MLYRLIADYRALSRRRRAPESRFLAHILKDIIHIICLTSPRVLPGRLLVDRPAQLEQQVGTEEGTPRTNRDHRIGPLNIGPFNWQCAQPSFCVQIRHAVTTPVVAHGNRFEGLSPQRMKRVRDGENLCSAIATVCNTRFSIKGKSSAAWGTPRTHP